MYLPFDSLPDHARIWIYQADRELLQDELIQIEALLRKFCESWNAHQQPLQSSYAIEHKRFIILAVNEQVYAASGCSIDSSVAVIRQIETNCQVSLTNRLIQAIKTHSGIETKSLKLLKEELAEGIIDPDTLTFNNLVPNIGEFKKAWVTPIKDSWLGRYVPVS